MQRINQSQSDSIYEKWHVTVVLVVNQKEEARERSENTCLISNELLNVIKSAPATAIGSFCICKHMQRNFLHPIKNETLPEAQLTLYCCSVLLPLSLRCGCLSSYDTAQHRTYLYILLILKLNHNFIIASSICTRVYEWSTMAGTFAVLCASLSALLQRHCQFRKL